jgi:hypothetical protein
MDTQTNISTSKRKFDFKKNLWWILVTAGALIGYLCLKQEPAVGIIIGTLAGWLLFKFIEEPENIFFFCFIGPFILVLPSISEEYNFKLRYKLIFIACFACIACVSEHFTNEMKEKQLYEIVINTNTIESCDNYLKRHDNNNQHYQEVKSIQQKLREQETQRNIERRQEEERAEAIKWNTASKAWSEASNRNTVEAYKKYLELYPHGNHANQAKKIVIDKEVDGIFGGEHGNLPSMERTSSGSGKYSTVSIYNNTSYTLTIRYSGSDSKKIDIPSQQRSSVSLPNGNYRIAASVNASNVRSFAGTENLSGGEYDSNYYIQTSRY